MKLAPSHAAAARGERTELLRRDRAAAKALRSVFPAVEQLRLDMRFEGTKANTPTSQSHELYPAARAFFTFPCAYADCDGQFDLTAAVSALLAKRSLSAEGVLECRGNRASGQSCSLRLLYKITATYHKGT
jgi:hypothetical protein